MALGMLTGGEKYNVKQIIIQINEMYPKIKEILNGKNPDSSSSLNSLYKYTLDIFMALSKMTTNIISSNSVINEIFNSLQDVHCYKDVNKFNKENLMQVTQRIPELEEALINLVESDTSNRESVLKQIMDELGIVDPNAKKRKSLW